MKSRLIELSLEEVKRGRVDIDNDLRDFGSDYSIPVKHGSEEYEQMLTFFWEERLGSTKLWEKEGDHYSFVLTHSHVMKLKEYYQKKIVDTILDVQRELLEGKGLGHLNWRMSFGLGMSTGPLVFDRDDDITSYESEYVAGTVDEYLRQGREDGLIFHVGDMLRIHF